MISFHCSFCNSRHFLRFSICLEDVLGEGQSLVDGHVC